MPRPLHGYPENTEYMAMCWTPVDRDVNLDQVNQWMMSTMLWSKKQQWTWNLTAAYKLWRLETETTDRNSGIPPSNKICIHFICAIDWTLWPCTYPLLQIFHVNPQILQRSVGRNLELTRKLITAAYPALGIWRFPSLSRTSFAM